MARAGGDGGLLAAFDERLPFALTAGQRGDRRPDRARPRPAAPDEPAAPGRGRLRQDPGRAARDAARRRLRRPGRAAGAHRGARPAAPPLDHRDARRPRGGRDDGRDERRAAHRLDDQGPAHRAAVPARDRRGRHRDRHPRAAGGPGPVLRPRPRRGRRAAPVRRRAARRAHRQGARVAAARAGDDRDADPAHGRDDGLRRPRGLHAHRAAGRPRGDPDHRRPPGSTTRGWIDRVWARVREEVGKGHQAYVVCPRISGDELEQWRARLDVRRRGRRQGPRRTLAAVEEVVAELDHPPPRRAAGRCAARPDAARREGPHDARLRGRRDRRPGLHDGDRGRRRRRQRDHDGDPRRRPVRHLPAAPAARPGRPRRPARASACWSATPARQDDARERLDALARTTDGFELSRVDLEQRREGDVLGRSQSGYRSTLQNLRVLRDEDTIVAARGAAEALLDADDTTSPATPICARRWRPWRNRCRVPSSWRSPRVAHDPDHRGQRRRAPDHGPLRTAHPADHRPGARGAVLQHRGVVRLAAGAALPRPLRRFGSGRPRGLVARRRVSSPWSSRTGVPPA